MALNRNARFAVLSGVVVLIVGMSWMLTRIVYGGGRGLTVPTNIPDHKSEDASRIENAVRNKDIPQLVEIIQHSPPQAASTAILALKGYYANDVGTRDFHVGEKPPLSRAEIQKILEPQLKNDHPAIRSAAYSVLGFVVDRKGPKSIFDGANDPDANVRASAIKASGNRRVFDYDGQTQIKALTDPDRYVRASAIASINNTFGIIYPFPIDGTPEEWAGRAQAISTSLQEMKDSYKLIQKMLAAEEGN